MLNPKHTAPLVLILTYSAFAFGNDVPRSSPDKPSRSQLSSTKEEWKKSREKVATLAGEAEIRQSSWSSSIDIPVPLTAKDFDPAQTPTPGSVESEQRDGSFFRIETAKVAFKVDVAKNKLWCKWVLKEPLFWLDSKDGSKIITVNEGTASSIVTDADFFHQESGSRVDESTDGQLDPIARHDMAHQRGNKITRGVVFRDPSDRGRRRMDRSTVFQPLHLLKLGGQYPDIFLERQENFLKPSQPTEVKYPTLVRPMTGNSSGLTMLAFLSRSEDDPNPLVCETDWIPNPVQTSPLYLLSEWREFFKDKSHLPPSTQVNWTWDESHLKAGRVLPLHYDLVIRSNDQPDRVEFERNIIVKSWEVNPSLSEADFSIASLEPEIGDLIVDREANTIAYFGRDKQTHDVTNQKSSTLPLPLGPASKPGSFYLVAINAVILACGAIYLLWRWRNNSRRDAP